MTAAAERQSPISTRPILPGIKDETGDRTDLAQASRTLRQSLHGYFARRGVDPNDLEDATQDVFLRAARQERIDRLDNIGSFLMRIAASVCIDRHRRRQSHAADQHVEFDPDGHAELAPDPEEFAIARQALSTTTLLLMELPERTRTVFILNRLENVPNREIAIRLGISLSAVEKHMGRAIRHLMAHAGEIR